MHRITRARAAPRWRSDRQHNARHTVSPTSVKVLSKSEVSVSFREYKSLQRGRMVGQEQKPSAYNDDYRIRGAENPSCTEDILLRKCLTKYWIACLPCSKERFVWSWYCVVVEVVKMGCRACDVLFQSYSEEVGVCVCDRVASRPVGRRFRARWIR